MTKAGEQPTITQADRDAAAELIEAYWSGASESMMKLAKSCRAGHSHGAFVRHFAKHRTTSLAAQDNASGKMWEVLTYIAAASECEASRAAAKEVMAEVEPSLSAPLAAQDGLVEALEKVRKCALVVPSIFPDTPPSVSWIVSELTKILPEMDAALSAIKGDKS